MDLLSIGSKTRFRRGAVEVSRSNDRRARFRSDGLLARHVCAVGAAKAKLQCGGLGVDGGNSVGRGVSERTYDWRNRRGIELHRRKSPVAAGGLERWLVGMEAHYGDRILPITAAVADAWRRLSLSQPLPVSDDLIAATALEHRLTVVTRNVADFARSGVGTLARSIRLGEPITRWGWLRPRPSRLF